jgi:hypothetical protein
MCLKMLSESEKLESAAQYRGDGGLGQNSIFAKWLPSVLL